MNALDVAVLLAAVAAGVSGWRFGFFARVLSWCGVAVGLLVGIPYVSRVVTAFGGTSTDSRVTVAVLYLVLVATLGHALGLSISALAHRFGDARPLARWDRVAGAAVGTVGVAVFAWIMIPSLSFAQGWPARLAEHSAIVGLVDDLAPEQPDQFAVVGNAISDAPYPGVVDSYEESSDPGPLLRPVLSDEIDRLVSRSIVKVSGRACDETQTGSGWVTTGGLVVTNAHVVAGEEDVTVEDRYGAPHRATVVAFDPVGDLAVLDVPTLTAPGLEVADGRVGDEGSVYGFPGGGQLRVAPARVLEARNFVVNDIYRGAEPSERGVLVVNVELRPGDSGAALVNRSGAVMGVAFAEVKGVPHRGLAIVASEVQAVLDEVESVDPIGTGPCL